LHSGSSEHPVDYEVEHIRDGGSSSARAVFARQNGTVLVAAQMSFCPMKVVVRIMWTTNNFTESPDTSKS
jgi:acyl-CoA thioesterase